MRHREETLGPTTTGEGARRAIAALRARNVDPKLLLCDAGFGQVDLDDQDLSISAAREAQLIELSADALQDSEFGLRIAATANPKESGLFYALLSAVPSVREIVTNAIRYMPITNASVGWSATPLPGGGATLRLRYLGLSRPQLQHTTEYHVAIVLRFIRYLASRRITPMLVTFSHNRTSGRDVLKRYFGCPVEFSQEADGFVLSKDALVAPIPTCDPFLFKLLQPYGEELAKSRAAPAGNYRDRVESKVYATLSLGQPKIEAVACLMATSERTLVRRLAEEGTSFSKIVDELRQGIVQQQIGNHKISIGRMIVLLGYTDPSVFNRAFHRWTGTSPSYARKHPEMILAFAKDAHGVDPVVPEYLGGS